MQQLNANICYLLLCTECNKLQNVCWCIKFNNEYINIFAAWKCIFIQLNVAI